MSVLALVPLSGLDGTGGQRAAAWLATPVDGVSLLVRSVRCLVDSGVVDRILVVTPGSEMDPGVSRVAALVPTGAELIAGPLPAVCAAETAVDRPDSRVVLVHDPLRAFTPPALITRVVAEVLATGRPVVPVLPCSDTVQRLDADGRVTETLDRAGLRVAQTPVGYPTAMIRAGAVDCARPPRGARMVPGDPVARRLAGPVDLALAGLGAVGSALAGS